MQQTFICPKCNSENPVNSQFCLSCGSSLQINCPNCGALVDVTDKFCSMCGAGLGWANKVRDIQLQISQVEGNINSSISRNYIEIQDRISKIGDEVVAQQSILNNSAGNIYKLLVEEHRLQVSRSMNRVGLGLIGLGLAVIGVSYVLTDIQFLTYIGVGIVLLGFILQFISNFITA